MKKRSLVLLMIPVLLSGCSKRIPLTFEAYLDYVKEEQYHTHDVIKADGLYERSGEYGSITLPYSSYGLTTISSLKNVASSRDGKYVFSSKGDLKLLVVPVRFKGAEQTDGDDKKILINNAFFGKPEKTSYESVASYYNKSSYGKVKITGEVTNWFETSYTIEDAIKEAKTDGAGENISRNIAAEVAKFLHEESGINLDTYDVDGDHYVDGVYLVYDYPQDDGASRSPLLWAYFDKVNKSHNINGDIYNDIQPYLSSYSWSSFYFTGKNSLKNHVVDANTYIHEVGHLFGLEDYYNTNGKSYSSGGNYDKSHSGVFQPTGFMDMMDYNLGDHCSFSKYLLDWVNPMVLKGPGEITLHSFTETGDFILIPALNNEREIEWNGTPFDEYLLIEYFTPTGLNDSFDFPSYSYFDGNNNQSIYTYPTRHGVRVYHIDARLAYYQSRTLKSDNRWIDDPQLTSWINNHSGRYVDFLNTNATLGTVDSRQPVLVNLLEANEKNNFYNGVAASDQTLFGLKSTFGVDSYKSFVFNKTSQSGRNMYLPYSFEITKLSSEEVTLKFSEISFK